LDEPMKDGKTKKVENVDVNSKVWHTLRGAALALGIRVEERAKSEAPAKAAEPPPPLPEVKTKPLEKDPEIEAVIAEADRRATELLRSLGYE